ncbi:MAG TPA: multidrug efflux RND transporter permease subunit [Bryobacteraceae bacterium]|nr:multidrug efflux RND transporter permease subunit [Bryobacteraceae bacterium]
MSLSSPFIRRPVATSLLTAGLAIAGAIAYTMLPVAPLPEVEFPTINVYAGLPGASPETMASAVATPLERQFGRIAGVTEMTSSSGYGSTSIVLQFDLNRDIDAAARDVQAAINAARGQLPANLPNNPTYRKVNPADSPIMILALTSDRYDVARMYDAADSILAQKLSQIEGVGQVTVGGGAKPAVRVELNPYLLNSYGIGLDQVRTALASANANRPTGSIEDRENTWQLDTTDQLSEAREYQRLVIAYRNGAGVRLGDVAQVYDSVEDRRNAGLANGQPAVLVILFRQPAANMIATVDRVKALLPQLQASIPPAIKLSVVLDRTTTIRASVEDVQFTLMISVGLVILVVFIFLRNAWATIIPSVAAPLSLLGTFGVMYLAGYTLDNLSLMALTISTGFVVDDAIVVIENIARYLEMGLRPVEAALRGAREIGFTVLSMSVSLVAVFIPILLMGGIVGRLFREFAIVLTAAIGVSLMVSLTTTPMLSARFLRPQGGRRHGRAYRISERAFHAIHSFYEETLGWVLHHPQLMLLVTIGTVCLSVYLYIIAPKGFFPQQDTGRMSGSIVGAQDISFPAMREKLAQFVAIIKADPAVQNVMGFTGGSSINTARAFVELKPLSERKVSADMVIERLRPKLARIPGATLYLQASQDIRVGGRGSNSQYQYTLRSDNLRDLDEWSQALLRKMRTIPILRDVNTDQQTKGLEQHLAIDRDTASRLGISPQILDEALYDLFGQRPVSTIYSTLNQYHVVMEMEPGLQRSVDALRNVFVRSSTGAEVPLSQFVHFEERNTTLSVNHQGQFPAITLSFALAPGVALGDAVEAIDAAEREIGMPANVQGSFQGTAQAFQSSLANEPILILAALVTVYIVLGILYESYIHPLTILSTLPSAGVGAILALLLTHVELSVIALIGIVLLIGIVKKNAIMMIDFALEAERKEGKNSVEAIYEAALLRFRPILMTTMAALLGGVPLAVGGGTGSELRRPLGITIVGGLIVSQMLTLYTTPVIYLYLDRLRLWAARMRPRRTARPLPEGLG